MYHHCVYKKDTMNYLNRFDEILETMMEAMSNVQLTDSISHNFIVQMIPHHQAAIQMSKNILLYTDMEPLRNIAGQIITEQTKGIAEMKAILPECSELLNLRKDICLYQWHITRIMNTMFSDMRNACADNQINADFLREMIPHHKGAVLMAENALKFQICCELCPMLENIINTQKKEILRMQKLLCH